MAKASDNPFPSLLVTETAAASIGSPAAGKQRLFVDTDHVLKYKNAAGTVSNIGAGGVAADPIWDTKGDLAAATGADTAAKLAAGTNSQVLTADSTQTTGLKWATPGSRLYEYTVTGADVASIDSNVDGTTVANFSGYDALEVFMYLRTDEAVADSTVNMIVNNDSGANYDRHYAIIGSALLAGDSNAVSGCNFGANGASSTANYFTLITGSLVNYAGTVGYKPIVLVEAELQSTASGVLGHNAYLWRNTAAITRIKIAPGTAGKKFKVGSRLLVYGR